MLYLMNMLKKKCDEFKNDESGIGVIEVVLIMVIVIAAILIFKDQIMAIINSAFNSITNDSNKIIN